ncbi:MAG: hypothetical protein ABIC04_06725 [Nanoarchaeota archaeon]
MKNFEKEQIVKLDEQKIECEKAINTMEKNIEKTLTEEKSALNSKKEEKVVNAKDKAKELSKEISFNYQKKIEELETKSAKNFKKAVDKIFVMILE